MIFEDVYEYYMYLGTEDAINGVMQKHSFFESRDINAKVREKCLDAYMFGFLMAGVA